MVFVAVFTACTNQKSKETIKEPVVIKSTVGLEQTIENLIDSILKVKQTERRKALFRFLSYKDQVDGGVAEEYCMFAAEYPKNNTRDFFEILSSKDTDFLDVWAKIASAELALNSGEKQNINKEMTSYKTALEAKTKMFSALQAKLVKHYLERLNYYTIKSF